VHHGSALAPLSFDEAASSVLEHLRGVLPMGLWAVTRREDAAQVFEHVRDDAYGVAAGTVVPWEASLCVRMVSGASPQVVPDVAAEPGMAGVAALRAFEIGSYLGAPIRSADGELHGTLCAFAPGPLPPDVERHRPLLDLLAGLLSQILLAEALQAQALEREAELRRRADVDALTGLATRAVLLDRLEHALALHGRDGTGVTVLLLDLDDFKLVNDTLGHVAGDDLLVHLSHEWLGRMRPGDTLARLGGDEFAVLVERSSGAQGVADAVSDLAGTYAVTATDLRVTASVGLAHVGPDDATPTAEQLLHRADVAMYAAKRAGGGRLVTHDAALAAVVAGLPRPQGVVRRGEPAPPAVSPR